MVNRPVSVCLFAPSRSPGRVIRALTHLPRCATCRCLTSLFGAGTALSFHGIPSAAKGDLTHDHATHRAVARPGPLCRRAGGRTARPGRAGGGQGTGTRLDRPAASDATFTVQPSVRKIIIEAWGGGAAGQAGAGGAGGGGGGGYNSDAIGKGATGGNGGPVVTAARVARAPAAARAGTPAA